MSNFSMIFLVIQVMIYSYGCSTPDKINKNVIKTHNWVVIKTVAEKPIDLNHTGKASTNLDEQGSACAADDIFKFRDDNVLEIDNGEITCDLPSLMRGSWNFEGEDSLVINHPLGSKLRCKIVSITNQQMILKAKMNYIPGGIDVTYTFKSNE